MRPSVTPSSVVAGQIDLFSHAQPEPAEDEQAPAAAGASAWTARLLSSPIWQAQKELVQKHLPEEAAVVRCLEVIERLGGTLTPAALAQQGGILPLRLDGFLAKLQRLLNVDGYEVLLVDRAQNRVSLNVALLRRQFELG